eukprot:scaffold21295_cov100-Isochrysis_galbana.AAC.2
MGKEKGARIEKGMRQDGRVASSSAWCQSRLPVVLCIDHVSLQYFLHGTPKRARIERGIKTDGRVPERPATDAD